MHYKSKAFSDRNNNGIGEYGFIAQLGSELDAIAKQTGRSDNKGNWIPPLFTGLSQNLEDDGSLVSRGYRYQIYLPDEATGMRSSEQNSNNDDQLKSAALQEQFFLIIAWPEELNQTGRRIFAITPEGKLLSTNQRKARDDFIEQPSWKQLYPGAGTSFKDVYAKGLSSAWTYFKP